MKTTPRDFFLHLGATIALYASTVALINLAFEIVNRILPDALNDYSYLYYYANNNSIVWPISMLVVLVPILYCLEWVTARDVLKTPEKKDIWIRRWRIYLTLFLTGATIVIDLITLIDTYLNGEITARFIWKVVIILVISASIFVYYLLSRMSNESTSSSNPTANKKERSILAWLGIIMVIAGIADGFIVIGLPTDQRALRLEQQKINAQRVRHTQPPPPILKPAAS